jgi:energy-coupling factor transporter ATP-binding protein EcfA2
LFDLGSLVLDDTELLAHERGWIWVVYYTQSKLRTHFALIHGDGTPLAHALADEVIAADRDCGGQLHSLSCLNPPPPPGADTDSGVADALKAYAQYLANECGFIQLDGLPADSDVGSRRLRLENLFVPLHLDINTQDENEKQVRQIVGAALSSHPRLALLAPPGGGKSTLLKRLAVAYTDAERQRQITDDLPQCNWLPLFIRCRELRDLSRASFAQLIDAISDHEHVGQHAAALRAHIDRALFAGRVLLLIDGLDEISNPGDRAAFVCTLRTTLQAYPGNAIVVTSREAGFRHVAAHSSPLCALATLSPFDADDIRRLTVAWHREVIGESDKVRIEAEQLAATIVRNDRIRRLAVNPLLLTTLLLVKRWVGSLPIRRAMLYDKAVEVLLMTWNIEGHEPIPEEEALPRNFYRGCRPLLGVFLSVKSHIESVLCGGMDKG